MTAFFETDKILDAWASASARLVVTPPAIQEYANALGKEYGNGTVMAAAFELELPEPIWAMGAHFENWKYSQLLEFVWDVPGVSGALPPLERKEARVAERFERQDVFALAATLSRGLHNGGAYSDWSHRPPTRSFDLGGACARAFAGSDPQFAAYVCHAAWCSFFFDVAWDFTVVVVRPSDRRVEVLLATDTD